MRTPIILSALLLGACSHGLRQAEFTPSSQPSGVTMNLDVRGTRPSVKGELYAVDTGSFWIRGDRLTRVPWNALDAFEAEKLGYREHGITRSSIPAHVAKLRPVSRFPQGLSGELLAAVLQRLGQDSVLVIDAPPPRPRGEAQPDALSALADAAARETQRFADPRAAIAAGYRRLGADFPGMGEHWLDAGAVLANRATDPTHPAVLSYAAIDGKPQLIGLGFVVTTVGDEVPDVPGWPEHWHEHSGPFADESGAAPSRPGARSARGTRVWILHVWSPLANPRGRYVPDNWALPFARLGLGAPHHADVDAAQALALVSGGDVYWTTVLTDAGLRTRGSSRALDAAIANATRDARAVASNASNAGAKRTLIPTELAELARIWSRLRSELASVAGPRVAALTGIRHSTGLSH